MTISTVAAVLAEQAPEGPEFGKASPIGLLIVILLLVATIFLIWSMNRQLRKLPQSFDTDNPEPDQAFDDGTDLTPEQFTDPDFRPNGQKHSTGG